MIKCKKCGWQPDNESYLDLHHIIPKWMGGTDKNHRIYLCGENKGNDCHRKLHEYLKEITEVQTNLWLDLMNIAK